MAKHSLHDDYSREEEIKGSSNRSFGLIFAALFALIGAGPLVSGREPRLWSLALAAVLLAVALLRPALLGPLNRLWLAFGLLLHRIVNPLLMGLIFFTTLTPIALIMRSLGKDPLSLRLERQRHSYWIKREPPGPKADTMRNQF